MCFAAPDIAELVCELESVTNWLLLGLNLGISDGKLLEWTQQQLSVEDIRVNLLNEWIRTDPEASWLRIVAALRDMEEELAKAIASKHSWFTLL